MSQDHTIDMTMNADASKVPSVFQMPSLAPEIEPGLAELDTDPRSAGRSADTVGGLLDAILRLKGIIEEETVALEARQGLDFDEYSRRKNRSLLELVRSLRAAGDLRSDRRIVAALTELAAKLEKNRAVLQMHLEAIREISAIMTRAIRETESDGTYSIGALDQSE